MRRVVLSALLSAFFLAPSCDCGDPPGSEGEGEEGEGEGEGGEGEGEGEEGEGEGEGEPELEAGPVCTPRGWCWETPLPAGGTLSGVWTSGPDDVWAASQTHLFHWDGAELAHIPPPTATPYVNAAPIWGSAPDDVWSHGFTTMIHWDGTRWSAALTGTYASSIHGVSRDDVWAAGFSTIYHFDGSGWLPVHQATAGGFQDVWAYAAERAVVGGTDGAQGIVQLVDRSSGDVVATDLAFPASAYSVTAVIAFSDTDVWAANPLSLHRLVDGTWTPVSITVTGGVIDMWASGPDDVWILDQRGVVFRTDGTSIESFDLALPQFAAAISGSSPTNVWVSSNDGSLHQYDGAGWTAHKEPLSAQSALDLALDDAGAGFAITPTELLVRGPSGAWSLTEPPTQAQLTGLARAGDDTFLFAGTASYRRAVDDWQLLITDGALKDACATSDGSVWGVGASVQTFDGAEWIDANVNVRAPLDRVLCDGAEAWAYPTLAYTPTPADVGVLHYDGATWGMRGFSAIRSAQLIASTSIATDRVYLVADDATTQQSIVMRFDGVAFEEVVFDERILGVHGTSATDLWFVGAAGAVLRDTGAGPQLLDGAPPSTFRFVHSHGDGAATIVSENGAAYVVTDGATPTFTPLAPALAVSGVYSTTLLDAAFVDDVVYAVGDDRDALWIQGGDWQEMPGNAWATGVEANAAGVFFLDYLDDLVRWDGVTMQDVNLDSFYDGAVYAPPSDDVVVALSRYGDLYLWDGVGFSTAGTLGLEYPTMIFGTAPGALWVAGESNEPGQDETVLMREDDGAWAPFIEPGPPLDVGVSSTGDTLMIDAARNIWRRDGAGWELLFAGPEYAADYPAAAAQIRDLDDIWAVTLGGVLHWDGAWDQLAEPLGLGFSNLVSTDDGAAWALGQWGGIARLPP